MAKDLRSSIFEMMEQDRQKQQRQDAERIRKEDIKDGKSKTKEKKKDSILEKTGDVKKKKDSIPKKTRDVKKKKDSILEKTGDVKKKKDSILEKTGDVKKKKESFQGKNGGTKKAKRHTIVQDKKINLKESDRTQGKGMTKEEGRKFTSRCPYNKKCGGCQFVDIPYEMQLKRKQDDLKAVLGEFGRLEPLIGMEQPDHYRNKVHAVFGLDAKKRPIAGVYEEKTHYVVDVESCFLENQKATAIIRTIKGLLRSFKIKTYDEDSGYGLLRHVLIRTGFQTGQIMVVLVLGSPILPSKNNFVKALLKEHPEITTIIVNVNNRNTSMVLGDKEQVIYGKGYIEDILCEKVFKISPKSFYQVNPIQTEKLYGLAISYAGLTGKETVLDAYCGIGTIGLIASEGAKRVIGVELNSDAIRDAVNNAKRNHIRNVEFYNKDAGEFMVQLAEQGEKIDVVFMDPPRAGSDEAFLSSVVTCSPKKIVYVSCNPETLARDLKYLIRNGYKVVRMRGMDMFPHTYHVETVVLLSKLKSSKSIEVKIELDEMDLTQAESKATYEEIKQYIMEKAGLKVSQLYIAQVKRKHGLIERVNYNVGSGKSKVPQVPIEKEKAIEDALRHFKMI